MKLNTNRYLMLVVGISLLGLAGPSLAEHEKCSLAPGQAGWLEQHMQKRESGVAVERNRAIKLLRVFLVKYPGAPQRADVLFRLAELYWENAEANFLKHMRSYDQALENFRIGSTKQRPPEPRLDLTASIKIYEEILEKHPDFQHADTVLYLYGFGLNEQGNEQAALAIYRTLIKRYPKSAFVADAHLAIGEYHFAKGEFKIALNSYGHVLNYIDTHLTDLALYKTAWCYFKLGNPKKAAARFKRILNRADELNRQKSGRTDAAAIQLKNEALEDLALTFSESGGAKEAYRFMKQVGGEEYSIGVLRSLGDVFFRQARYLKAVESYRILVERFPLSTESPEHRARIAEAYERAGRMEKALVERRALAQNYGPGSSWAKKNVANKEALAEAERISEESLRFVALYRHKQAQDKRSDKTYQVSAGAYREYLKQFPDRPESAKMHFYLGEVLFKLKNYDKAAKHYEIATATIEDAALKIEASYAAVLSFDQLRKKQGQPKQPPTKKQPLTKSEQGFVQAVDQFARLAPEDKKLPQLRFEQGKTFFYRANYKQASQQLLALVQNHPNDRFAEPAGDLALSEASSRQPSFKTERLSTSRKNREGPPGNTNAWLKNFQSTIWRPRHCF
ncbi:MAG: tetratricopeptide repeat protein [Deltaproteobacteria bacterium]|nr:tetratricopeptide repeat protein [Deltaproteobacteria bacterium]